MTADPLEAAFGLLAQRCRETLCVGGEAGRLLDELAEPARPALPQPLAHASTVYGLDQASLGLLALALATEIRPGWSRLWRLLGDSPWPTAGVALGALGHDPTQLQVLDPDAPLQHFALLEPQSGVPLVDAALRVPRELIGRLSGAATVRPIAPVVPPQADLLRTLALAPSVSEQVDESLAVLRSGGLVCLQGPPGSGRDALAAALAGQLGHALLKVGAATDDLARVRRDAAWWSAVVQLSGPLRQHAVEGLQAPVIWVGTPQDPMAVQVAALRQVHVLAMPALDRRTRTAVWARWLDNPELSETLAGRYAYGPARIEEVVRRASSRGPVDHDTLDHAADQVRTVQFDALAQKLPARAGWSDLVVSDDVRAELELALAWVRHGPTVFGQGDLGGRLQSEMGLTCLLHGPPGTGKTLAARVLAAELKLPVYRVDLSQVMDKYIGESEKKLARLFDEAQQASVMLFFDEADTVFGRRTDVKDAHDRYANVETGYLLQRLEEHTSPVVLATNLLNNIDPAFLRRLHVVVRLDLPQPEQLRDIWRLHLPGMPEDVDLELLCTGFSLSGAEVRNITAVAGLLAASEGTPLGMAQLVRALARELKKAGRLVAPRRFGKWAPFAIGPTAAPPKGR